jgi:hypothetical protein
MKSLDGTANEQLRSMFEAAMDFGLSDEQVWDAAKDVAARTPEHKPAGEYVNAVADELALRIEGRK